MPMPEAEVVSPNLAMAYVSPEGAILAAWRQVETQLRKVSPSLPGAARSLPDLIHVLGLPADIERSLHSLRRIRNEVVHGRGRNPSPEAAADFVEGCEAMAKWLSDYGRSRLPVPVARTPYWP
jgi:hypothetical protein